jgi:hypothetical protein
MIKNELREFVDTILDKKMIDDADVQRLARDVMPDGAMNAEEVDVLVALDRALKPANANWAEFLVASVVQFVVWTSRPTGVVTRDQSNWLISTLSVGEGPTKNAMRIAFEVVREAERCDEPLITFSMSAAGLDVRKDFSKSGAALLVA